MVSIPRARPSAPALEPVPKFQQNLNQVRCGPGELMEHVEQPVDPGDLPSSAVMLGTQGTALGPFWCSRRAARPASGTGAECGVSVAPLSPSAVCTGGAGDFSSPGTEAPSRLRGD